MKREPKRQKPVPSSVAIEWAKVTKEGAAHRSCSYRSFLPATRRGEASFVAAPKMKRLDPADPAFDRRNERFVPLAVLILWTGYDKPVVYRRSGTRRREGKLWDTYRREPARRRGSQIIPIPPE